MEKKTMGSLLSALRRAEGLTQQEVADRLLVSNRAVSRWERDEAAPDISLLPAIADLFGVTVDELLRGERRRPAEGGTASVSFSAAPTETQSAPAPSAEARPASPDLRTLRGARALCRREQARFRTMLLISAALVLSGYICLLGITYGSERVYIGFAMFALFCVGSVVLSVIAATRLADVLREQNPEMGDPALRLPAEERAHLLAAYVRGCFAAIVAPVAGMVLALPLVLYKKHSYIGERFMMDAKDYLLVALLLSVVSVAAGWLLFPVLRERLWEKWSAVLAIPIPERHTRHRPYAATLRQMNRRQWVTSVGGLLGGVAVQMVVMAFTTPSRDMAWYVVVGEIAVALLLLAGVVLPAVTLIRFLCRERGGGRAVKTELLLSGVRNVAVSLLGSWFWFTGIVYVSSGSHDAFSPELLWTTNMIFMWAIVTLMLFGAVEVVRRLLRRQK